MINKCRHTINYRFPVENGFKADIWNGVDTGRMARDFIFIDKNWIDLNVDEKEFARNRQLNSAIPMNCLIDCPKD